MGLVGAELKSFLVGLVGVVVLAALAFLSLVPRALRAGPWLLGTSDIKGEVIGPLDIVVA